MLGSLATPLPVPVKRDLVATMAGLVPTAGAARLSAETIGDHHDGAGDSGRALAPDAVEAPADSRGREGAAEADSTADGCASGSGATGQARPAALARIFSPDRPPAALGGGVPAVQRGCSRGTAARPRAPGRGTKRIQDKLSYIWGFFDLGDKAFSPQSRSNQVFCKCCRNASKADMPISGRVDTMYSHVASCLAVPPEDREAAAVAGKLERQHRTLATNANPRAAGPGVVVGLMDALVPRNYSAKQSQDFETDLLKWMLFSRISYNLLESPLFRSFIRKWMPGIKNIPTRHAMSSTVLERLLGSLSAAVKTVYSKGAFVSLSFDGWKSGGGRKLIGMLAGLVSKNTGEVSVDFSGTSDITALAETSELVVSQDELELERARADNDYLPPPLRHQRRGLCLRTRRYRQ